MSELKVFELKVGKNLETDSPLVVGVDDKWNSRVVSGEKVYLKYEADKVIADKDREIAELKADNADLRDDKESTDAILDERNAEIAKLQAVIEERDKTIDELKEDYKEACDRLQTANLIKDEQLAAVRHHKYKRCLAMAEWCEATALWCYQAANTLPTGFHATLYGKRVMIEPDRLFKRHVLLTKWSARWRELAEKFKPSKEQ